MSVSSYQRTFPIRLRCVILVPSCQHLLNLLIPRYSSLLQSTVKIESSDESDDSIFTVINLGWKASISQLANNISWEFHQQHVSTPICYIYVTIKHKRYSTTYLFLGRDEEREKRKNMKKEMTQGWKQSAISTGISWTIVVVNKNSATFCSCGPTMKSSHYKLIPLSETLTLRSVSASGTCDYAHVKRVK